jgi:hypothetical protein
MKSFFKRIVGLDKIEANIAATALALKEAEAVNTAAKAAKTVAAAAASAAKAIAAAAAADIAAAAEEAKLTPKDRATLKKESWINVIQTHVNKESVRNGFFELDWNEWFVKQLKTEGYGVEGDPDEEIVDRWFRELCATVVVDGDFGGPITTGNLDIPTVMQANR